MCLPKKFLHKKFTSGGHPIELNLKHSHFFCLIFLSQMFNLHWLHVICGRESFVWYRPSTCCWIVALDGAVIAVPTLLAAQDVHLAADCRHGGPVPPFLHARYKLPPIFGNIVPLHLNIEHIKGTISWKLRWVLLYRYQWKALFKAYFFKGTLYNE